MADRILVLVALAAVIASCAARSGPVASNNAGIQATPIPTAEKKPDQTLSKRFGSIAEEAKGKVGVYALVLETGEFAVLNPTERFAMQSVVKVPISMAVMKMVADGKLTLDTRIKIEKEEFVPAGMHSPIRDKIPNGGELTIGELIESAVSVSDGTASDVLQRVAGGAKGVQTFIDQLGVSGMNVRHTHKEFAADWDLQYKNSITAESAVRLLQKLWDEKPAASPGDDQKELILLNHMYRTPTGPNRLKGLLPLGTPVAHKTGTGRKRNGITSATNDVGIITLPNGDHLFIAVLVGDSAMDEKTREAVIAKIARSAWDTWSVRKEDQRVQL